jgi:hypothetical protein
MSRVRGARTPKHDKRMIEMQYKYNVQTSCGMAHSNTMKGIAFIIANNDEAKARIVFKNMVGRKPTW